MIAQGVINQEYIKKLETAYKESLEDDLEDSRKIEKTLITPFMQDQWEGLHRVEETAMREKVNTAVTIYQLEQVAKALSELPADKKFLRKTEKLIGDRKKCFLKLKIGLGHGRIVGLWDFVAGRAWSSNFGSRCGKEELSHIAMLY